MDNELLDTNLLISALLPLDNYITDSYINY